MNKLILVSFVGGRCGSSMTMGLLERCGVNCGPNADKSKSVENPGGFYEIESIQMLWRKEPDWLVVKALHDPFTFEYIRKNIDTKSKLIDIFSNEYGSKYPIAVKAMDFACASMFENDPEFDIRIVCPVRNIDDQCRSIARMWGTEYTIDSFKPWLTKMYAWRDEYKKEFNFQYLDVDFNSMLDDPEKEGAKICDFCGINSPESGVFSEWVRKEYSRSRA